MGELNASALTGVHGYFKTVKVHRARAKIPWLEMNTLSSSSFGSFCTTKGEGGQSVVASGMAWQFTTSSTQDERRWVLARSKGVGVWPRLAQLVVNGRAKRVEVSAHAKMYGAYTASHLTRGALRCTPIHVMLGFIWLFHVHILLAC